MSRIQGQCDSIDRNNESDPPGAKDSFDSIGNGIKESSVNKNTGNRSEIEEALAEKKLETEAEKKLETSLVSKKIQVGRKLVIKLILFGYK